MLEKIDKLRKAPQPVREHVVAVVTISAVAVITVIWFVFSLNSFLKKPPALVAPAASSTPPAQSQTDTQVQIQAPFPQ